jgi:hypothetical protein
MAFRITANPGEGTPFLQFGEAAAGPAPVEVVIDDARLGRLEASHLLRLMADRLLECDWPPGRASGLRHPRAARPDRVPSAA